MPNTTVLASATVAPNGDHLSVELVEPDPPDLPPTILIRWPDKPTTASPATFDHTAADIMRIHGAHPSNLSAPQIRCHLPVQQSHMPIVPSGSTVGVVRRA